MRLTGAAFKGLVQLWHIIPQIDFTFNKIRGVGYSLVCYYKVFVILASRESLALIL